MDNFRIEPSRQSNGSQFAEARRHPLEILWFSLASQIVFILTEQYGLLLKVTLSKEYPTRFPLYIHITFFLSIVITRMLEVSLSAPIQRCVIIGFYMTLD